ncbi:MAG: alpha/beta hydrolase [Alphaproteobacteria bacterium]|nr:alpha/beta hydrolase [Alphaproteobacteria bacterium]
MSFDDMPDLGQMSLPEGPAYAAWAIEQSKLVAKKARIVWDVPFGEDFYQKLDIFLPDDTTATDVPVLIFFHGGAWRHGFKEWNGFMAPNITSLPAILVSANYRLAPGAKYPKPLDDVIAALVWVYRNIRHYGGDNRRIFMGGHSAGGHLAALATLKPNLILSQLVPKDVVKACFPLSAPLDLRLSICEPGGRRERLIKNFLERDNQDHDASATESVRGNTVPFFLAWGDNDLPELMEHNKRMVELMSKEECVFEHHLFRGYGHFDTHRDTIKPDSPWVKKVRAWMTKTPAFEKV